MAYANLDGFGWLVEDMQAWTAAHYEPKLRFNSTPVYSVTLAEDVSADSSTGYIIDSAALGGAYAELWVVMTLPSAMSVNCACRFSDVDDNILFGILRTTNVLCSCFTARDCGARYTLGGGGNTAGSGKAIYMVDYVPIFGVGALSKIDIRPTAVATFPAGTTITVYAATEV